MTHTRLQPRHGSKVHACAEGYDEQYGRTFCGRMASGMTVTDEAPTCLRCMQILIVRSKP